MRSWLLPSREGPDRSELRRVCSATLMVAGAICKDTRAVASTTTTMRWTDNRTLLCRNGCVPADWPVT